MKNFGCVNNTIRLRSGLYLDLADPKPDQFKFSDIAGALAKICRFGGQCVCFYSVAEHSWHCCQQAQRDGLSLEIQQAVLMHDAAEAFVGDMVKPLKIMMPDYEVVEAWVETAISEKFRINFVREADSVRKIDREMLIAERNYMFSKDTTTWTGENDVRKLDVEIEMWDWVQAESKFSAMARRIGINTGK